MACRKLLKPAGLRKTRGGSVAGHTAAMDMFAPGRRADPSGVPVKNVPIPVAIAAWMVPEADR